MMLRRKEWGHSKCPHCGWEDENNCHVIKCADEDAPRRWTKTLAGLETWMDDNDTDPLITKYVLEALRNWMDDAVSWIAIS